MCISQALERGGNILTFAHWLQCPYCWYEDVRGVCVDVRNTTWIGFLKNPRVTLRRTSGELKGSCSSGVFPSGLTLPCVCYGFEKYSTVCSDN